VLVPTVALSLHALLALQAPPAPPVATTGEQTVLWFRSPDATMAAAIDARALLDAVAVYTRDLGVSVRVAGEAAVVPADVPAAGRAAATLRAQGARLGFWCEMRPDGEIAVLTVVAPDGHLELHLVERTGAHEAELYRAIGLKLRSVLTGTATPEPPPPPRVPPTPTPTPATTDAGIRAAPAAAPPSRRLFLSAGYDLSAPFDSISPRHALALDGTLALESPFELHAGTALAPRLERTVAGAPATTTDTASIFDWPIMAGARVVRRGARFSFGAGAFAALHLLWASATATGGATDSSFAAAAGAGAEVLARMRLTGALAGELRLYAEVPVPATHYSLQQVEVASFGARAGVGLGLVFPAP
jgi:hypothetical protein